VVDVCGHQDARGFSRARRFEGRSRNIVRASPHKIELIEATLAWPSMPAVHEARPAFHHRTRSR
jgi:hypothetical protein